MGPASDDAYTADGQALEAEAAPDAGADAAADADVNETDEGEGSGDEAVDAADVADEAEADSGLDSDEPAVVDDEVAGSTEADGTAPDATLTTATATGAAWTTTPVAPDPEATEAALAALAAKPEVTLEPPPPQPLSDGGTEPPDEGTPVLLVGGILVGAFIVALMVVLVLFRPFDSGTDSAATPSPSPILTEEPSAEPTDGQMVDAPDFAGQTLSEAELIASDYGLILQVTTVATDAVEPNTVLDQDPTAGSAVLIGSTVEVSVAAAVPSVSVPDIADLPENVARRDLRDAGLVPGDRSEASDESIAAGNVISSDPAAAAEVAPGSSVSYVVSSGPAAVAVPDIVDMLEADALTSLGDAGLVPGDRSEASDEIIVAGNVISSDPAAAAEVAPGQQRQLRRLHRPRRGGRARHRRHARGRCPHRPRRRRPRAG